MTDNEQRILIAEACGLLAPFTTHSEDWCDIGGGGTVDVLRDANLTEVPDYCNDLNAIRGAMLSLESSRPRFYNRSYVSCLQSVMGWPNENGMMDKRQAFDLINATARQRAEAFLRTIDKWKEAPNG